MTAQLPSTAPAKNQAKRWRAQMAEDGQPIGHAKSLELVAHQHGFRDWNTMFAAIGNGPPKVWAIGDRVSGSYLSQPVTRHVVSLSLLRPGWFRLVLHLDSGVDVVTSDGFSNFRVRIRGIIGPKGHSVERTSNKQRHLQLDSWSPGSPALICKRPLGRLRPMAASSRSSTLHPILSTPTVRTIKGQVGVPGGAGHGSHRQDGSCVRCQIIWAGSGVASPQRSGYLVSDHAACT